MQKNTNELNAKEIFGRNLRKLRESRSLLQKDFADIIGVKKNSLSNYENGKQLPDALMLKKIADFFGTTIDALLSEAEIVADNNIKTNDIIIDLNNGVSIEEIAKKRRIIVDGEEMSFEAKKEILEKIELEYLRSKR